jgi:hypothetical protein
MPPICSGWMGSWRTPGATAWRWRERGIYCEPRWIPPRRISSGRSQRSRLISGAVTPRPQALSLLHWTEAVLAPHGKWILTNRMFEGPALLEQARLQDGQKRTEEARRAYSRFLE